MTVVKDDAHVSPTATLLTAGVGGILVILAYIYTFSASNTDGRGYFDSVYWLGISPSTAKALAPLQVAAAVGYLVFLGYSLDAKEGVLTYLDGKALAVMVGIFSLASVGWPLATKWYLYSGEPTVGRALLPATCLVAAAAAAMGMTAGAFEANLPWPAVLGIVAFAAVVVVADGVGWNAKLLLLASQNRHPEM